MKCVQVSLIPPINGPNVALLICRATDCLEDMSQSAIVHDGIFGFGDEKQNIQTEKAFEEAAAKGFRPCASMPLHLFLPLVSQQKWANKLLTSEL